MNDARWPEIIAKIVLIYVAKLPDEDCFSSTCRPICAVGIKKSAYFL